MTSWHLDDPDPGLKILIAPAIILAIPVVFLALIVWAVIKVETHHRKKVPMTQEELTACIEVRGPKNCR
jgi:hypothetical protein